MGGETPSLSKSNIVQIFNAVNSIAYLDQTMPDICQSPVVPREHTRLRANKPVMYSINQPHLSALPFLKVYPQSKRMQARRGRASSALGLWLAKIPAACVLAQASDPLLPNVAAALLSLNP